jgi:acyl carrier protein
MSYEADTLATDRVIPLVHRLLTERSITASVSADDDLRAIGLTSLDMVALVLSVEAEFDLQIPETAITPSNFRTVSSINALIQSLRSQS